jgi:hypothetical protein
MNVDWPVVRYRKVQLERPPARFLRRCQRTP